MNKFILGSILAAISLLAIYGTSASNRVASWVDGEERPSQTNFGGPEATNVALNADEENRDPFVDVSGRTPLEKAGYLPKRQTTGISSNFGQPPASDTPTVVQPQPTDEATNEPSPTAGGNTTSGNQPAQIEEPIRALW